MHQTKKGNQWHFGMKAHIGVDAESGLTHSLETTPANESDEATVHAVLHGGEEEVWGDAGYQGVGKHDENKDAAVDWRTAMKPGRRRQLDKSGSEEAAEKHKASMRAKVEHPFLYVKRHFGYAKVRYRVCRRMRSGSRFCSVSRICSSPAATPRGETRDHCARFPPEWRETGRKSTNSQFPSRFRTKRKHFSAPKWIPICEARIRRLAATGNRA